MINNIFDKMKESVISKVIFIGILILVLLIPLSMVDSLIRERKARRSRAVAEVSQKWGKSQRINGPILVIPYRDHYFGNDKKWYVRTMRAYFLPESINVSGKLKAEIRKRGIFEVPLYSLDLSIQSSFAKPDFSRFKISARDILWEDAFLMVGIPDTRGIKDQTKLVWKNSGDKKILSIHFSPGPKDTSLFTSGIHATLTNFKKFSKKNNKFTFKLHLRGTDSLSFVPLGKETTIKISSNWQDPSFFGNYLPSGHTITEQGFDALWKVAYFGRNFPQRWLGTKKSHSYSMNESAFGVKLFMAVDIYQKATRAVKYGSLFIFLTFLSIFLFEIINKLKVHPIQYLLGGFGLILFYLLLISLSEHSFFMLSYILASISIMALLTFYFIKILKKKTRGVIMGVNLATLYGYLYILLINQDYALLIGSLGLFLILAFVMYITRNIDWYSIQANGKSKKQGM